MGAGTLCAYVHRPTSQPNWVKSERSKYLWNQENIPTSLSTKFDPSTQAGVHACYVLACLGPYLSQIGLDKKDEGIYGIGRTYQTYLSTYYNPSMQASMHACYVLACSGLYLSQIWSDQRYQSIDRIRRTYQTCLSTLFERSTQFCMHARFVLVCICPYLSRFGSDPKDRDMYGIEGTCRS